jgi:hypothetical protein
MKNAKEKSVNLIPLLEGSVIEATVLDGGHSLAAICFGSIMSLSPNWNGERFDDGRPKVDWMLDLTVHDLKIFKMGYPDITRSFF